MHSFAVNERNEMSKNLILLKSFAFILCFFQIGSFAYAVETGSQVTGLAALDESQILKSREFEIRLIKGQNFDQTSKQISTAFADIGFGHFDWYPVGPNSKTRMGIAHGTDYQIITYLRNVKGKFIMRINVTLMPQSSDPDVSEKTYSGFWDLLGKSNFVSSLNINPRAIH